MGTQVTEVRSVGILGGGQLGMMSALAANRLGIESVVWAESPDEPALAHATIPIVAPFHRDSARRHFFKESQFYTLEFENVPLDLVRRIARLRPGGPSPEILRIAANRWLEKEFFSACGMRTVHTKRINRPNRMRLDRFRDFPFPGILKTETLGYDGRGQVVVERYEDLYQALETLGMRPCVLEQRIPLRCEFSIIVARNVHGETVAYPAIENMHEGGILRTSRWPVSAPAASNDRIATMWALKAAEKLGLVGVIAFEFMVDRGGTLYANEMAPRPHNSGHGTIEAATTSQFEMHIRAVCGILLPIPRFVKSWEMRNLIGVSAEEAMLSFEEDEILHWYGKKEARPGRKMGHVTRLFA